MTGSHAANCQNSVLGNFLSGSKHFEEKKKKAQPHLSEYTILPPTKTWFISTTFLADIFFSPFSVAGGGVVVKSSGRI